MTQDKEGMNRQTNRPVKTAEYGKRKDNIPDRNLRPQLPSLRVRLTTAHDICLVSIVYLIFYCLTAIFYRA